MCLEIRPSFLFVSFSSSPPDIVLFAAPGSAPCFKILRSSPLFLRSFSRYYSEQMKFAFALVLLAVVAVSAHPFTECLSPDQLGIKTVDFNPGMKRARAV